MATQTYPSLHNLLYENRKRYVKGSAFTHTCMKGGTYYIQSEEMDQFYKLYTNDLLNNKDLHITEKHSDIAPVLIDFDFRFDPSQTDRKYNIEMIDKAVKLYVEKISQYVETPKDVEVYVMEKTAPKLVKETIKDGIHIIISNIVTRPSVQLVVRENLLQQFKEIFEPMNCSNTIEDIFDECVIDKNNWLMLGSKKPDNEPYVITHHWTINNNEKTENEIGNVADYVKVLSIRNKFRENILLSSNTEKREEIRNKDKEIRLVEKAKEERKIVKKCNDNNFKSKSNEYDIENAKYIIEHYIGLHRVENFHDWIKLGWCLKNIDDSLLKDWERISMTSDKYVPGECANIWENMEKRDMGIGSLIKWAKDDGLTDDDGVFVMDYLQKFKKPTIEMIDIPEDEIVTKKQTNEKKRNKIYNKYDIEKTRYIVKHFLKEYRTEKYKQWIQLGWCLYNIDDCLLEDWDKFSQCSKKYKAGECESLWEHMEVKFELGMSTLVKWAVIDGLIDDDGFGVMQYLQNYNAKNFDAYAIMKKKFEKHSFKLVDLTEYGTWKNHKLIIRKKGELKDAFSEMKYIETKISKKGEETTEEKSFIETWFDDPYKRVYDTYDFLPPPLICPEEIFNTWAGFKIEQECITETDDFEFILYLLKILTNFDDDACEYLTNWLADLIQNPGKKNGTAVVFKSKPQAGKGTLINLIRYMLGYVSETSNPTLDIFGNHGNAHIDRLLCSIDEVKASDTSKVLGRLKNVITSDYCISNPKGQKQVEVRNSCRFIFTSNESFPVNIDKDDRRYFATECSNKYCGKVNKPFWEDFHKKLENRKSVKGFFDYLKNRDISKVNWMDFPQTELRSDIIEASLHPIIYWMDDFIRSKMFQVQETHNFTASGLYTHYKQHCVENKINVYSSNSKSFGIILKDNIDFAGCGIEKKKSSGVMVYVINKNKVFGWLNENNYSIHDSLPIFEFDEDGNMTD